MSPRVAGKCPAWRCTRHSSACPIPAKERDMPQFIFSLGVALMASLMAGNWVPLRAEERVVHFFQVNALTGQAGSYGTRSIHGVELAAKHLNDAGGFADTCGNTYTIKLSVWDMANSREQAIAGLRKAADDASVLAVLGSTPSPGLPPWSLWPGK